MRKLMIDIHLFPNTPEGHGVLHQLQTRAEAWAEGVGTQERIELTSRES
jgi:hypothetical protein